MKNWNIIGFLIITCIYFVAIKIFDFDFDSEIVSIVDGSYWFQAIIKTNATMGAYLKREN